jgi:hypothetical protein
LCAGRKIPGGWGIPIEVQMPTKNSNTPFLSLHSLAAARGDGLRPEFVDLFKRLATGADATLSKSTQSSGGQALEPVKGAPASEPAAAKEGVGRRKY